MNRRLVTLALTLSLLLALLTGCAASNPATPPQPPASASAPAPADPKATTYPVTLKDSAGRDVLIAAEPRRIVSVAPSNTELLFALGKGSSLVGRSEWCDFPAEAAAIESVGGFFPPNYEKIVSLSPDLVLLVGGTDEARDKLANEYKLTVFVVDPQTFEQLYASIATLGTILNAQPAAEGLVAGMKKDVADVAAVVAKAASKPKVFYEVWHDPLMTAGSGTFIDDLIKLAGGHNAGEVVSGWVPFSLEQLAAADPDVIITGGVDGPAEIKARKGWEGFAAVKSGRIFPVDDPNILVRPGPRLVLGLKWMAGKLHPDLFK